MNFLKNCVAGAALTIALAGGAMAENSLRVAYDADPVSLDPYEQLSGGTLQLNHMAFDPLVRWTQDLQFEARLAESWEQIDETTTRFKLRDGVTFHSGNAMTADDVVGSFARVVQLDLTPAFILTQLGWTPENVGEMVTGEGNTVTVRYDGDFSPAFVMNVLAARPASIVDMATVMANEVDGDMGNAWLNANTAGTGPFAMTAFRPAELIRMEANPDYFNGGPAIDGVIIRHVAESATQQLLLEAGDVDIARNLTPDQVASLGGDDISVETFPQAAVHFLSFNQAVESLTPPAVWEAARYLVDYEGMTSTIIAGQMETHQAFWPEGFPGALTDTPYSYDPERAAQILADAGVELPITVTLDVINAAPFTDMAQSLQASFAEAGIMFEILPGTGSQVITRYRERSHEAMLLYWGPDFMDPHSNAKAFAYNSDNSQENYAATTTWRNSWAVPEEMNAMTTAALTEADPAVREEMYLELQRQVQASSPIVIMFQASYQVAMAANVTGYVNGATSDFVFYRLVDKS